MRRRQAELAVTLRSPGAGGALDREPVQVALLDARRRTWAPLALRAAAVALALVGLAGIGSVAGRAPELGSLLAAGVGSSAQLAQLGAADHVIGFPAAPRPPPDEPSARARAAVGGAAPRDGTEAAGAAPEASLLPVGGGPCPASADATGDLRREPRALARRAPRAPAVRARASAVDGNAALEPAASAAAPAIRADGRVVLNRATLSELMRLPGVGAKRAAAIIEQRQRLGRFREASELLRIKGIGPRTLERLLPQLVLD